MGERERKVEEEKISKLRVIIFTKHKAQGAGRQAGSWNLFQKEELLRPENQYRRRA